MVFTVRTHKFISNLVIAILPLIVIIQSLLPDSPTMTVVTVYPQTIDMLNKETKMDMLHENLNKTFSFQPQLQLTTHVLGMGPFMLLLGIVCTSYGTLSLIWAGTTNPDGFSSQICLSTTSEMHMNS
eukprot:1819155-Rhodomonas_salina.1